MENGDESVLIAYSNQDGSDKAYTCFLGSKLNIHSFRRRSLLISQANGCDISVMSNSSYVCETLFHSVSTDYAVFVCSAVCTLYNPSEVTRSDGLSVSAAVPAPPPLDAADDAQLHDKYVV